MQAYEFDLKTNQIEPKDYAPLILNEEILLNVVFSSETGFTISFEDFRIEHTDIEFDKTVKDFYKSFYKKLKNLANTEERNEEEQRDWDTIKKLIGNLDALKN